MAGPEGATPGREGRRALAIELLVILAAFVAVVLAVDPHGDFPLNDDWNFALGTWWFAEHGEFRFARFTGMSLRAQVVWGALWTRLFGESFEVLRASTLTLAFVSLLLFRSLLVRTSLSRSVRLLAVGALLANPYFLWSAHTYMTQIPFLAASLAAVLAWVKGAEERSSRWFVGGGVLVIVSAFVRQSGIATLAVGAVVLAAVWRSSPRQFRIVAAGSLVFVGVALAGLLVGTELLHGRPEEFALRLGLLERSVGAVLRSLVAQFTVNFAFIVQYSMVAFFGLGLVLAWGRIDRPTLALALVVAIPVVWGASTLTTIRGPLPYDIHGNILMGGGLGPPTLRDVWIFRYPEPRPLPMAIRWTLALVTVVVGGLVLGRLARLVPAVWRQWPERDRLVWLGGLGAFAGGSAILFSTDIFFDRYVLDAAWALALLMPLATRWTGARFAAAAVVTAALLVFSAAGTSDYLAWNRARWEGFERLRARGVELTEMDGGYEINQYLLGGFDGPAMLRKPQFSVVDDEWILTFHEVKGYRTVDRVDYDRWSGSGTVFIQQRTTGFRQNFDLDP